MISPREYFLYLFGALTVVELPVSLKTKVMFAMGKEVGLSRNEMQNIINEVEGTLKWKVNQRLKDMM